MGFVLALLVTGLVAGLLARLLLPGPDPMGIGATILVGVAGCLLGGLGGELLFGRPGGFVLGVACTMLLLWLLRRGSRRRTLV